MPRTPLWSLVAAASHVTLVAALSHLVPFASAQPPGVPPAAVRGEIVLPRTGHEWMSQQIEEPCILPNPKVPGRLIMFYSAVSASNRVVAAIGKAWAETRDPFRWHQDEANPVFRPAQHGWDSSSIRLDTVLYIPEEDAYYIYYSGTTGTVQDRIGLAICPAGDDGYSGVTEAAITRYGTAPVLAPEPAAPFHEDMASQAAVIREWNVAGRRWDWYMYYSYRGKDGTLPGIRLATSRDGKTWTRQFNADDPRGMGQIFRSTPRRVLRMASGIQDGRDVCAVHRGGRGPRGALAAGPRCQHGPGAGLDATSMLTPCCRRRGTGCTMTGRSIMSLRRRCT